MDQNEFEQLGKQYKASRNGLLYAISPRLGKKIAERFIGLDVLECCSGAGFLTIELSKVARQVFAVDIDETMLSYARYNAKVANVGSNIKFILGDILNENIFKEIPKFNAAIIDPVWNDQIISNMSPPADKIFKVVSSYTANITLILPPNLNKTVLQQFPEHEKKVLYLDNQPALTCLFFNKTCN